MDQAMRGKKLRLCTPTDEWNKGNLSLLPSVGVQCAGNGELIQLHSVQSGALPDL